MEGAKARSGARKKTTRRKSRDADPNISEFIKDSDAYDRSVSAFRRFDANGDGVISRQELSRIFVALDPDRWNDDRIEKLLNAADKNGDGLIGYEEFVAWLMGTSRDWEADRGAACLKGDAAFTKEGLIMEHRDTKVTQEILKIEIDPAEARDRKLGIQVDGSDGRTLLIKGIKEDGLVAEWNANSPTRVVQVGDRILEINGITDNVRLMQKELTKKVLLEILVEPQPAAKCYTQKVSDFYDIDLTELSIGMYSTVRMVRHVASDTKYAMKSMHKKTTNPKRIEAMLEIHKALDHPNICKLFDVFEDHLSCHMIMEYCEGGEMLERILRDTAFTERQTVRIMRQLFAAVAYLNSKSIAHRDIRPDHILLLTSRPTENAVSKLVDFRAARTFVEGETRFYTQSGSCQFAAPEVVAKSGGYDERADMWSLGVVMYLAISGYLPFAGENEADLVNKIGRAVLIFPDDWARVSLDAKELIKLLVQSDVSKRIKPNEAIRHPWIEHSGQHAIDFPLHHGQEAMKAFVGQNKLKKAACHAIAQRLKDEEIHELQEMFALLDKNGDKMITFYELKAGLDRLGKEETLRDLQVLFEEIDVDGSRRIEYTEFLAAATHQRLQKEEDLCWAAFQVFDADGSGTISKKELANVLDASTLKELMSSDAVSRVLQECDADNDGMIDFPEFMAMMRAGVVNDF